MESKLKQQLYMKLNYKQPYENSIKISLISEYSELIYIFNQIENKTKFLYLDYEAINRILYNEEEIIQIENKKYEYSFIYYLNLLINVNKDIVNFNYDFDFIKEIDNENNKKENELQKLFISKIILDLICSFEGIEQNEELEQIEKKNKMYIIDNKNVFKNYNLNLEKIEEISLEKLYLDILIELIKNKKLENYDFAYDILIKLDLENIDINSKMLEELKNILNDENYLYNYKMNDIKDFFKEENVNFYYILIKYIFKNSCFIYNIPLLYNTRNAIIKIIKTKNKEFLLHIYNIGNIDLFKRINYNIKFILDSNYYYNIFLDLLYENKLRKAIINENRKWEEYMKILNILEKNNDKLALINYLYESKKKEVKKIQLEFEEVSYTYKQLEKMIQEKKVKKMRKDDKLLLSKYFIDENNKDSLLRIFGQDSYNFFLRESIELIKKEKNAKEKENKLMMILKYYKTFFFESKKDDINKIENAINKKGDLEFKISESDLQKAQILNERIPLINYIYKNKNENKTELEIQQIIEKYNSLEKLISERKLMKDNIENETFSKLCDYFNDKNNKNFLINIFGKENYDFYLKYFSENIKNNKITKKNGNRKTNKNNKKENTNEINKQISTENEDSNLLSLSTKHQSFNSKNSSNISEQKKIYKEEKLANNILKKSEIILNTKKEEGKPVFIFENVSYGEYHIFVSYEKLLLIKEYFIKNKIESIIAKSFIKYMEFLEEFKDRISKEFILGYKLKIGLKFQIINKDENESIFNINCLYNFYSPDLNVVSIPFFKEENILLNKTNSKKQGFQLLLNEINDQKFEGIESFQNETKQSSDNNNINYSNSKGYPKNKDNSNDINSSDNTKPIDFGCSSSQVEAFDLKIKAEKYQILKIIGILGRHKNTAEYIIELNNGYYVTGGTDNILKIYDKEFRTELELKDIKESVYSCFEIENLSNQKEKDYDVELIACCNKYINKISISLKGKQDKTYKYQKFELPEILSKSCVIMKDNTFAFIGHNSTYLDNFFNLSNSKIKKSSIASGKSYLGSIKIDENNIAITSNKVLYNGEDKLIFYNIEKKVINKIIDGSFTPGTNGLALMPSEGKKDKNKILLCASKKYFDDQKNGIYLVLEDKQGINYDFHDTRNFEVFCFCPILIINQDNAILEKGKKKKIEETDYFFVGGFNADKKEGEIKLYKVIYSDNTIEFVQDIEFERNKDFNGFEGAVSCVIQAKKHNKGYILVTCYSGKVYLLTPPNLDYYLKTKEKNTN